MRTRLSLLLAALFFLALSSCTKEGADIQYYYYGENGEYEMMSEYLDIPSTPMSYVNNFPSYYTRNSLPFDKDLATLGRVLFYDKKLSKDGSVSCASCHDQRAGFADNRALSLGVANRETSRNSLALGSVFSFNEYYGSRTIGLVPFFWDNRAASVQEQSIQTLANPLEMDMEMHEVVDAVNDQPYYEPLLIAAYGKRTANDENVLDAISEFVNSIGSFDSKYDEALSTYFNKNGTLANAENSDLEGLSTLENEGRAIFLQNCASCHGNINGMPGEFQANNGLDEAYDDKGIGDLSGNTYENGVFKVPTLRNIALTAPYMHDGRFNTLEEVLDHYSTGVQDHPNLSFQLKSFVDGQPVRMEFDQQDREALLAFLHTFTDDKLAADVKYSDPFK